MDYQKTAEYIYSLDKSNIFNAITKYCIQKDQKLAPKELEDITNLSNTDQNALLICLYNQYQNMFSDQAINALISESSGIDSDMALTAIKKLLNNSGVFD